MDDFFHRQINVALSVVEKYKNNQITLNTLILDLESISEKIQIQKSEELGDLLTDLEVINAVIIEEKRLPNTDELKLIFGNIEALEAIFRKLPEL